MMGKRHKIHLQVTPDEGKLVCDYGEVVREMRGSGLFLRGSGPKIAGKWSDFAGKWSPHDAIGQVKPSSYPQSFSLNI